MGLLVKGQCSTVRLAFCAAAGPYDHVGAEARIPLHIEGVDLDAYGCEFFIHRGDSLNG